MGHRFVRLARGVDSVLELGELHFAEGQENVVFAGKMIEERAFADVGDVGDVLDGGFHEAFFSEELQRRAKEAFADFGAAALAAVWWIRVRMLAGEPARFVLIDHNDLWAYMTISHQ